MKDSNSNQTTPLIQKNKILEKYDLYVSFSKNNNQKYIL